MQVFMFLISALLLLLHITQCKSSLVINIEGDGDPQDILDELNKNGNGSFSVSDVDECDQTDSCPEHSTCSNSVGSFACACNEGFTSGGTGDNGDTSCEDINECDDASICENITDSTCKNNPGSYECVCSGGYEVNTEGNACVDIDECLNDTTCSSISGSTCSNIPGGHECNCASGFEVNSDGDTCVDTNECNDDSICSHITGAVCQNSEGSYDCNCEEGFEKDGDACVDINECTTLDPCGSITDSTCKNNDGGYECTCADGFQVNEADSACQDIDECDSTTTVLHDCGTNEICQNSEGSYTCQCAPGYEGSPCSDINECNTEGRCDINAFCHNTAGSYSCLCLTNFYGSGEPGGCTNVKSCSTFHNIKGNISIIVNAVDGDDISTAEEALDDYNSASGKETGVSGDAFRARYGADDLNSHIINVIDELRCDYFSTCVEDPEDTFTCTCEAGYEYATDSTTQCKDVDECVDSDNCGNLANCTNNEGSYTCTCPDGYEMVEADITSDCTDIDECKDDTLNDCHEHATCTNNDGGFTCACNDGYMGSGTDCESAISCAAFEKIRSAIDTLRTASDTDDTSESEEIINAYVAASGREIPVSSESYVASFGEPPSGSVLETVIGELRCDYFSECLTSGEGDTEEYICECNAGYEFIAEDANDCIDIDECDTDPERCGATGTCENNQGNFICKCNDGYEGGEGAACDDINECEDDTEDECGDTGTCENIDGGFNCNCSIGYEGGDNAACTNIDECSGENDCDENADCEDTVGSHVCTCKTGYEGDGITCSDINECNDDSLNNCHEHATCTNNDGGFSCACNDGFMGNGTSCENIDECSGENECDVNADCADTVGSHTCTCKTGYAGDGITCSDINECVDVSLNDCHEQATCTNNDGGFTCACDDGYMGSGTDCESAISCAAFEKVRSAIDTLRTASEEDDTSESEEIINAYVAASGRETPVSKTSYVASFGEPPSGSVLESVIGELRCDYFSKCLTSGEGDTTEYRCVCNTGYSLLAEDANECIDIDECDIDPGRCGVTGTCENNQGNFICNCNDGYEGGEGAACDDINECEDGTVDECGDTGTCENIDGGFNCNCSIGYEGGDNAACTNIDECSGENDCDENADCADTVGSHTCTCKTGYTGDGETCNDINECGDVSLNDCHEQATCTNNDGGFTCACNDGYMGSGTSCESAISCAAFEKVRSAIDTLRTASEGDDTSESEEIINAYVAASGRETPVSSTSYVASFGEPPSSSVLETVIGELRCDYFSECLTSGEGDTEEYSCECNTGYELIADDANECIDIDECATDTSECDGDHGICSNTQGSHECSCEDGYVGDGTMCDDVDECADPDSNTCDDTHATCTNTDGNYTCACNSGYMGNGQEGMCTDVLTCGTFDNLKNAIDVIENEGSTEDDVNTAKDLLKSYRDADGRAGGVTQNAYRARYTEINSDVDSTLDYLRCDYFSTCSFGDDSYACTCIDGYVEDTDNGGCKDVDECATGDDDCHADADCANTKGSFICTCKEGFYGNGKNCSDHDECEGEGGGNDCDVNANCDNVEGGHTCTCKDGFYGNGSACEVVTTCEAFDKVKAAIDTVQANTASEEDINSARQILQQYNAANTRSTISPVVSGDSYREQYGDSLDEDINNIINFLICDYNSACSTGDDGATTCTCNNDHIPAATDRTCLSVQTCDAFNRVKSAITTVIESSDDGDVSSAREILQAFSDATGHATAAGTDAFEARHSVNDTDVTAALNLLPCDYFSECSDSLTCTCVEGYEVAEAANTCKDKDECLSTEDNDCDDNAECDNTEGSYECTCNSGYTGNGTVCEDNTECDDASSTLCGANAECTDTPGSYECTCITGYSGNGQACVAVPTQLFNEDSDDGVDCDSLDNPLSCKYRRDLSTNAADVFAFHQAAFEPPPALANSASATRGDTEFVISSSAGSAICPKETRYASPSMGYTDEDMTTEVELFRYNYHRQWFIQTECTSNPTGVNGGCTTARSAQRALTLSYDSTTEKYEVKISYIYIPSGCQFIFNP